MTKAEIYSKILEVSEKSYYRWKAKDHKILIKLIEKYFADKELEEFLNTGRIEKFEIAQNNNYFINKSIKLYKMANSILPLEAKKIFFEKLKQINSYKIEDISNIIFYSIKDEDLDSKQNYINGVSKISIRLDLFKLFEKIDDFELEYFIRNFEKIKLQSINSPIIKNKKEITFGIYGIEKDNIFEFEEKFFKIEKNNFIKIKNIETDNNNKTTILFDIINFIYNEKKSIKNADIIQADNKLDLTFDEYNMFSNLIVKITEMNFF
jgi:hypothetical protein